MKQADVSMTRMQSTTPIVNLA